MILDFYGTTLRKPRNRPRDAQRACDTTQKCKDILQMQTPAKTVDDQSYGKRKRNDEDLDAGPRCTREFSNSPQELRAEQQVRDQDQNCSRNPTPKRRRLGNRQTSQQRPDRLLQEKRMTRSKRPPGYTFCELDNAQQARDLMIYSRPIPRISRSQGIT